MKKIITLLVFISLIGCGIYYTVKKNYSLEQVSNNTSLSVKPGESIVVDVRNYIQGKVDKVTLTQLSGFPFKIIEKSTNLYEVNIPDNYRGVTAHFILVGKNRFYEKSANVEIKTPFIGKVKRIATASAATCLQDEMGVYCWGSLSGKDVSPPEGVTSKGVLSAGDQHFCSFEDKELICWGFLKLHEKLSSSAIVATGGGSVCVSDNDRLKCWGDYEITSHIPSVRNIQKIAVGGQHACVLADNVVKCWGRRYSEDDEITKGFFYPTDIATGYFFSCVLDSGKVICWGMGSPLLNSPPLDNVTAITAAGDKVCAYANDQWYCWSAEGDIDVFSSDKQFVIGRGRYCLLSEPACYPWNETKRQHFPMTVNNPRHLHADGKKFCFQSDDKIICNEYMQNEETAVGTLKDFYFTGNVRCELNDHIRCNGMLGNVTIPPELTAPEKLVSGSDVACALQKGKVFCWGGNKDIVAVPAMEDVKDIALGGGMITPAVDGSWACAVFKGGVQCWGKNPLASANYPVVENPSRIVINNYYACVIDGKAVKCWNRKGMEIFDKLANEPLVNPGEIAINWSGAVCVIDDGKVKCNDSFAENISNLPIPFSRAREIAGGMQDICVIDDNGLTCMGNAYFRYPSK